MTVEWGWSGPSLLMLALTGDKTAAGAAAKGAAARESTEESLLSGETSVYMSVWVCVGVCAQFNTAPEVTFVPAR